MRNLAVQLQGYRLTTAEILYHLPDHPHLLQSFVWQQLDLAPDFPGLRKFLDFWIAEPRRQASFGQSGACPRLTRPARAAGRATRGTDGPRLNVAAPCQGGPAAQVPVVPACRPPRRPRAPTAAPDRALALRLLRAMVFLMVLIGGVTRLTESGLSITAMAAGDRHPAAAERGRNGRPHSQRYKAIPQYQAIHAGMTLGRVQGHFFWEYLHRLWGRLIGVVFAAAVPLFPGAPPHPALRFAPKLAVHLRLGRAARRARLVHGGERPRGPHRGQPIPPRPRTSRRRC